MHVKRFDAYHVYLLMNGLNALFFGMIFTVNMIYQATTVGLSPLQLVLVGTLLELTVFVFEIPTGIVADVFSRRLSIILGLLLVGVGFMLEGMVPTFAAILMAQVIWGLGFTFMSGAEQAWISDELGEDRAGAAFLRGSQLNALGGISGIAAGVMIGSFQINYPIILGGLGSILVGGLMTLIMPETGFKPTPREERSSYQQMLFTFRAGLRIVRLRPALKMVVAVGLFYGLYSEGVDRLFTPHMLTNFTFPAVGNFQPVVWFGLMNAVVLGLRIVVTEGVRRRVDTSNRKPVVRALFWLSIPMVASLIGLGLAGSLAMAVLLYCTFATLRGAIDPLYGAWMNQHFESEVRATMHSMMSQVDAIGQIAGGPIIGLFAGWATIQFGLGIALRATMVMAGLILSPVLYLYNRAAKLPNATESETRMASLSPEVESAAL